MRSRRSWNVKRRIMRLILKIDILQYISSNRKYQHSKWTYCHIHIVVHFPIHIIAIWHFLLIFAKRILFWIIISLYCQFQAGILTYRCTWSRWMLTSKQLNRRPRIGRLWDGNYGVRSRRWGVESREWIYSQSAKNDWFGSGLDLPNISCSLYIFGNTKDERSKNCSSAPCWMVARHTCPSATKVLNILDTYG